MVISKPSRLTRRVLLTGAAAFAAGTALGPPALAHEHLPAGTRPGHPSGYLRVHAAADLAGELYALTTGEAAGTASIRPLLVDADGIAEFGPGLPAALPSGFHPHAMAALGDALWVTGAAESGPDAARPRLLRISGERVEPSALPLPPPLKTGVATAISALGPNGLAVVIEGSADAHMTAVSRSHLAYSRDAGRTWTHRPLAAGLGEGHGTALAAVADGVFAVVADGDGTQTVYTGTPRRPSAAATAPGAGRPMAVVPGDAYVSVFSDHSGTVAETRYSRTGAILETAPWCRCVGELIAVQGRSGAWIEADGASVRLRTREAN